MTKRTETLSAAVRIRVMKRDRFRCTYCGRPGTDVELEIDHIIAVTRGGSNHISNLTTACRECNQAKGDRPVDAMASRRGEGPAALADTGITGMFLHTTKPDGSLHQQGRIVGSHEDSIVVQLFEWWDGLPSTIILIPVTDLSTRCTLYPSADLMRGAALPTILKRLEGLR